MHQERETPAETLSRTGNWAVYQCAHGCLHLRLHNLTLTFTAAEFHTLVRLLGDAYVRIGVRQAVEHAEVH